MSAVKCLRLLGNLLLKSDGNTVTTETVCNKNKVLGLYFSSSSFPACSNFTPDLIKYYTNLKSSEAKRGFEVIYVSSDPDEKRFNETIRTFPWLALPYNEQDRKVALTKMFCVQTIPSLVLIDAKSGELLTPHGCACVLDDPQGLRFPCSIRDPIEVLNELALITAEGKKMEFKSMTPCIKGIYFSARWCPPCKAFTPLLIKLYKKLQKKGCKFEVILVSSDLSAQSFDQYFADMPWLAVPYEDEQRRKELAKLYGVGGIPSLIILDEDNAIINKEGRIEINDDPEGEDFPWRAKLVDELSEKHVSKLNEETCMILFTACEEKELDAAHYLLLPVAEEYKARVQRAMAEGVSIPHLNFFYAGDAEICDSVRDAVQVEERFPSVAILDMPHNRKYVLEGKKEITTDSLGKFMRDYLASKLPAYPVGL